MSRYWSPQQHESDPEQQVYRTSYEVPEGIAARSASESMFDNTGRLPGFASLLAVAEGHLVPPLVLRHPPRPDVPTLAARTPLPNAPRGNPGPRCQDHAGDGGGNPVSSNRDRKRKGRDDVTVTLLNPKRPRHDSATSPISTDNPTRIVPHVNHDDSLHRQRMNNLEAFYRNGQTNNAAVVVDFPENTNNWSFRGPPHLPEMPRSVSVMPFSSGWPYDNGSAIPTTRGGMENPLAMPTEPPRPIQHYQIPGMVEPSPRTGSPTHQSGTSPNSGFIQEDTTRVNPTSGGMFDGSPPPFINTHYTLIPATRNVGLERTDGGIGFLDHQAPGYYRDDQVTFRYHDDRVTFREPQYAFQEPGPSTSAYAASQMREPIRVGSRYGAVAGGSFVGDPATRAGQPHILSGQGSTTRGVLAGHPYQRAFPLPLRHKDDFWPPHDDPPKMHEKWDGDAKIVVARILAANRDEFRRSRPIRPSTAPHNCNNHAGQARHGASVPSGSQTRTPSTTTMRRGRSQATPSNRVSRDRNRNLTFSSSFRSSEAIAGPSSSRPRGSHSRRPSLQLSTPIRSPIYEGSAQERIAEAQRMARMVKREAERAEAALKQRLQPYGLDEISELVSMEHFRHFWEHRPDPNCPLCVFFKMCPPKNSSTASTEELLVQQPPVEQPPVQQPLIEELSDEERRRLERRLGKRRAHEPPL